MKDSEQHVAFFPSFPAPQRLSGCVCLCGVLLSSPVLLLVVILCFPLPYFSKVSAAISSSGELRFLSEPTLSDTEPELTDAK